MRSTRVFEVKYDIFEETLVLPTEQAIFGDFSLENGQKSGFLTFCWRFPARRYILGLITHFQTHKHIGLTSVALDQIFRSEIWIFRGNHIFVTDTGDFWRSQPTTWSKIRFSRFRLAFSCLQLLFRAHNSLSNT